MMRLYQIEWLAAMAEHKEKYPYQFLHKDVMARYGFEEVITTEGHRGWKYNNALVQERNKYEVARV